MDVLASVDFAVPFWWIALSPAPEKASSLPLADADIARVQAVHMLKVSDLCRAGVPAYRQSRVSRSACTRVRRHWI